MQTLRFPFEGSLDSSSQVGQDLFVLSALKGKRNGFYIEVGAGPAVPTSNSYLLETQYDWKGVSVELNHSFFNDHKHHRKHHIELVDATTVNYSELLLRGGITSNIIDYVSLDVDAGATYVALTHLPFDTHKFSVITYEHDAYLVGPEFKNKSRDYLKNHGFVLVAGGIKPPGVQGEFEDWWVNPEMIDSDFINQLQSDENTFKDWTSIIFRTN